MYGVLRPISDPAQEMIYLRLIADRDPLDLPGSILGLLLDLPLELLPLPCERGDDTGHNTLGFLTERGSSHHWL